MRLTRARVTNFKSVLDSEWFTLDDLTCLVGKNESGKTAILEALEKISSVRREREPLRNTEYPRMNWSEYEESGSTDVAVETEWELDDDELDAVASLVFGRDNLSSTTVRISKDYSNALHWHYPFSLRTVVAASIAQSDLPEEKKRSYADDCENTSDLLQKLSGLAEPSTSETRLLEQLRALWPQGGVQATAREVLSASLPRFVYYSQYDRLPGRVSLRQLIDARDNDALEDLPGSRVFLALLDMVGTTPESIQGITTSEELISKLEAVETRLSRTIFKYWSQNKHLKVRFRFDEASPGDPPPFDSGKIFQTRIENLRHEATIRLDERSTGFIWFFSFLVWFSQVQKEYGQHLIVLLDEPGLTLHARAQADLLRYIREVLLPKYQVVYTTHSPFMIDGSSQMSVVGGVATGGG